MSTPYKFNPDALRAELGIDAEEEANARHVQREVEPEASHADVYAGFAKNKVEHARPHEDDNLAPLLGGAAGAYAQYKGLGKGLFNPDPELFNPRFVTAPQTTNFVDSQGLSDVQHTMQSGQGQRAGETGRQRENTHNQETQRQSWATDQKIKIPGAKQAVVEAGPMYTTQSGVSIPVNAAMQIEEENKKNTAFSDALKQNLEKKALDNEMKRRAREMVKAKIIGAGRGVAQIGQGIAGGAIAAPQLYNYALDALNKKPLDQTQLASGVGGLMMALGKNKIGTVGALAQLPYAIKHREEIMKNMNLADLVPDVVRMGMTGSELYEPAVPNWEPRKPSINMPPPSFTYGVK